MRRLSLEELQRPGRGGRRLCGHRRLFVEPDRPCDHGQPSWLLALGLI